MLSQALAFCVDKLKMRSEMVQQLRPDATHRLDEQLVPLLAKVANAIASGDSAPSDNSDSAKTSMVATMGSVVETFYALSQQFCHVPNVAQALASLLAWKQNHQAELNANALDALIHRCVEEPASEFDIHECQRLAEVVGQLTGEQYARLVPIMMGKLGHQAGHANEAGRLKVGVAEN